MGGGYYEILIYRLASNGYSVYFNDKFIGSSGDFISGNSSIWNGLKGFSIDEKEILDHNKLSIKSVSFYAKGLTTHPVMVTTSISGNKLKSRISIFNRNAILTGIGMLFISFSIVISLYLVMKKTRKSYLSLSVAMVCIGIYATDYLVHEYLWIDYFDYKKIVMVSFWLATYFISLSIFQGFNEKLSVYISSIGVVGIIVASLIFGDMIAFKNFYGYWYVTQLITVAFWVHAMLKNLHDSLEARSYFFGFVVLLIYSVLNTVFDMFGVFFQLNSPIIYIGIFSIMPLMLIYLDISRLDFQLSKEMLLHHEAHSMAMTDGLTGINNKKFLENNLKNLGKPFTIAMFDLDDFKAVNDTYGHLAGDEVLRYIANVLKARLREDDILCRYGGDEFIIAFECEYGLAYQRMDDFRQYIENSKIIYGGNEMHITISMGMFEVDEFVSTEEIVEIIDKALYSSKRKGKNAITAISNESHQNNAFIL